jgi:uncharacterized protein (TIGR02246 family)
MSDADYAAICRLIDAYSDAVFRRDAGDWGACWAEDATWHLMGQEVVGRAAIVAFWEQAMAGFTFTSFFAQPGVITIDGHTASGRIWTHEVLELPDGSIIRPVGRYDDRFVRTADGWRFAERRYQMLKG